MTIWFNGSLKENKAPLLRGDDRACLLGDGLFETILCRDGVPIFFDDHMQRLEQSARQIGLAIPYTGQDLRKAITDLWQKLTADEERSLARARISLLRGPGGAGLLPSQKATAQANIMVQLIPYHPVTQPSLSLMVAETRRNHASPASRMKTLSYMDNILARMEAEAVDADDALMLNGRDEVACLTIANIFSLRPDGCVVTPPLAAGILPGIVRAKILILADRVGIKLVERSQTVEEFFSGYCFASNSLMGLQPCHHRQNGSTVPRPQEFIALKQAYEDLLQGEGKR